jgi:hypothetical protein
MRAYLLIRDSVPMGYAYLAAIKRKDHPEILEWLAGSAETEYCMLDDQEFEQAKTFRGGIVLSTELWEGKELAIAFGPRDEWPEEFTRFRNYFVEWEKRREDWENITEETWLECDDRPSHLANFALPSMSNRKVRLFAIACCDLVSYRMVDERSRRAVAIARLHAEGMATDEALAASEREAREVMTSFMVKGLPDFQSTPEYAAAALASCAVDAFDRTPTEDSPDGWMGICCGGFTVSDFFIWHARRAAPRDPHVLTTITVLLRDICGNPFRAVVFDPAYLSPGMLSIARAIYEQLAFDRLPELADALEQSGCREQAILSHCRGPGPHVRGCWVLDLLLAKETAGSYP